MENQDHTISPCIVSIWWHWIFYIPLDNYKDLLHVSINDLLLGINKFIYSDETNHNNTYDMKLLCILTNLYLFK